MYRWCFMVKPFSTLKIEHNLLILNYFSSCCQVHEFCNLHTILQASESTQNTYWSCATYNHRKRVLKRPAFFQYQIDIETVHLLTNHLFTWEWQFIGAASWILSQNFSPSNPQSDCFWEINEIQMGSYLFISWPEHSTRYDFLLKITTGVNRQQIFRLY